ncbi:MAG TPA: SdpI family protein [Longimicrobium sp.]|nr:SdpI family protein [Longimicrobium sp.]
MKKPWFGWMVAAAMWIFSLAVYSRLPERIPSHWNLAGEVDGWSPRSVGAFIFPLIATGSLVLPWMLFRIDPRRANLERSPDRHLIINLSVLFAALVQCLTLGSVLGWPIDVPTGIVAGVGLLMVGIGNYLPRVRSNWWIGVRTPWTLSSERVWQRTHRLAGRVFVAGGAVLAATAFVPDALRGWIVLPVVVVIAAVPLVYSYFAWRAEQAENHA